MPLISTLPSPDDPTTDFTHRELTYAYDLTLASPTGAREQSDCAHLMEMRRSIRFAEWAESSNMYADSPISATHAHNDYVVGNTTLRTHTTPLQA